ncbi:pre-mRNA splicing factor component-domain-containing protein [Haematococcus lacustris]
MRIQIKGGVWKNTEDEILKAAVMKYGLNQWSRISSLLVRKSAKQCKARWYEWLDPSIKKTEWTREEDEKLLHLAKLMPTQWRTIAPIVGRTPAQSLDRYEKLLDMAVSKEDKYDPADDPRRLRPGEIDPNPESKPARPDAIDMDEEEKEMLSEARARLANTRGKKAKRKAREHQMEEARRLASLQKKRELKAAGIEMSTKDKRKRTIDYNAEVAFEKKPASGFFDTAEEQARSKEIQQEFRPVTVEELEGRRRKDIEEQLIKHDIKRAKLQEAHDAPGAIAQAAHLNDPVMVRRRGRMMLPAPQVSEQELEALARMSTEVLLDDDMVDGAGGAATRQLLGQYGPTPLRPAALPTPARTAPSGDRIMQEAQNLARLTNMATPLVGGENPELHPSDFSGITPKPSVPQTPNPLAGAVTPGGRPGQATPGVSTGMTSQRGGLAIAGVSSTPSVAVAGTPVRGGGGLAGVTPLRTPIRDEFKLNDEASLASMNVAFASKRAEQARLAALRGELRAGLSTLPAPQNEYQVVAPELELEGEAEEGGEAMEEDAADTKARKLREAAQRAAEEEKKKSKALQRGLPRPLSLDQLPSPRPATELPKLSLRERAEDLVVREVARLLEHDAAKYPVPLAASGKDSKEARKAAKRAAASIVVPALEDFPLPELEAAGQLLEAEVEVVRRAMGHGAVGQEEYLDTWLAVQRDLMWAPAKGRYDRVISATPAERIESTKAEFELARAEMEREAHRAAKVEAKVITLITGLQGRDAKLRKQLTQAWEGLQAVQTELSCFKALHEREQRAGPERVEHMLKLVAGQQAKEDALQARYKRLLDERNDLMAALQQRQQSV